MPPAPEFGNALGQVGIVEVFDEVETKNLTQTDGHIAVTGEIKVDIQGKRDGIHPEKQHTLLIALPEQLHQQGKIVRNQDLLAKTHKEAAQAHMDLLPAVGSGFQFPGHIDIPDDGTGNQLRKQCHIGTEGNGIFLNRHISPVHVNGVAEALEGVEADTHRQSKLQQRQSQTGYRIHGIDKKVRVFEQSQQRHTDHNGYHQPEFLRFLFLCASDQQAAAIKQQNRKHHQTQQLRFPPAVENQAGNQQHRVFQETGYQKIDNQHRGQKIV